MRVFFVVVVAVVICECVHLNVWVYVLYMDAGQRSDFDVFLQSSLFYSFETTSLHWTGAYQLARLGGQEVMWILLSLPCSAKSIGIQSHAQVFTGALESQTQAHIFVQLAMYLRSHLLSPNVDFIFLRLTYFLLVFCLYACLCATRMHYLQRPEDGTGSPGTGFISGCELPEGSESGSWVRLESSKCS